MARIPVADPALAAFRDEVGVLLITASAGAAYVVVGMAQDAVGLAPAMAVTFTLLIPAALVANRALRARQ